MQWDRQTWLKVALIGAIVIGLVGLVIPAGAGLAQQSTATPQSSQPVPSSTPQGQPTATPRPSGQPPPVPGAVPGPTQTPAPSGSVTARITYPPARQIINLQPFLLILEVGGLRQDATQIGRPSAPGVGHWLLLIDGVGVASGDATSFSIGGVGPGTHELRIQIRNNDRSPLLPPVGTAVSVCIEACSEEELPADLPEVPSGLPRTGDGGLLGRS